MFILQNDSLQIGINPKGAELTQLFSKQTGLEYLWNGDPAYWAKHSPVLFPVVGTLKNDTYIFEGRAYKLTRHGFARDMQFDTVAQDDHSITFSLSADATTLSRYPFEFRLEIRYSLEGNALKVHYDVFNTGSREMYFSIGAHPAFKAPLTKDESFDDYYIEFETAETAGRWPISPEGLIEALPVALLNDSRVLPITHDLFRQDAVVFKYLKSNALTLRSHTSPHGVRFDFKGFPYLGIWSGKNGNFICIEPWCGIADSVASHQQLIQKEGINMITPGQVFAREWRVEVF